MSAGEWVATFGLVLLLVPLGAAVDHLVDQTSRRPRHARRPR